MLNGVINTFSPMLTLKALPIGIYKKQNLTAKQFIHIKDLEFQEKKPKIIFSVITPLDEGENLYIKLI